jgi:hypothetical protein
VTLGCNFHIVDPREWLTPAGRSDAEQQSVLSDRQQPYYDHEVLAA